MAKKSIALDISDYSVEVVELRGSGSKLKVVNSGRVKLETGIIQRGRIIDKDKLREAVQFIFQNTKPKPIRPEKVIFILPESQVYIHIFSLDKYNLKSKKASEKELAAIVLQEAQKNLPLDVNELLYGYKKREENKILLIAANKKIVQEWKTFFQELSVDVKYFDVESLSLFRGLFVKSPEDPVCIVDIGGNTTNLSIFDQRGVQYTYSISIGGNLLTQKIAHALNIDRESAEQQKVEVGLSNVLSVIYQVLLENLNPIIKEVRASIEYFTKHTGQQVKQVILVGGTSNLKGILEYFQKYFVQSVSLGKSDFFPQDAPVHYHNFYIAAVGAARYLLDKNYEKSDPILSLEQKDRSRQTLPKRESEAKPGLEVERLKKPPPAAKKSKRFNVQIRFGSRGKVADIEKSAVDEKIKKRRLADSEFVLPQRAQRKQKKEIRSRTITLIVVIVIGVLLFAFAFWYRSNERKQRETEIQESIEQYTKTQTFTVKVPVTLSQEEQSPDYVRGRTADYLVDSAGDYTEGRAHSRREIEKTLESHERLWPEPLDRLEEGATVSFPLTYYWLVYNEEDANNLILKETERYNQGEAKYAVNNIRKIDVAPSEEMDFFELYAEVTIATNELFLIEEQDKIKVPSPIKPWPPGEQGVETGDTTSDVSAEASLEESGETGQPGGEGSPKVLILETGLGWLRVRQGPGLDYDEIHKIIPGEKYPLLEETEDWSKIKLSDGREGWISGQYAQRD